jgi:hypothetical protein
MSKQFYGSWAGGAPQNVLLTERGSKESMSPLQLDFSGCEFVAAVARWLRRDR